MTLSRDGLERSRRAGAALSDEAVRAIRKADSAGTLSRRELARMYDCSTETIARVCRGDTYWWVKDFPQAAPMDLAEAAELSAEAFLKQLNEGGSP